MESIPSRETRWFIEKILTKYWIYQNKNNQEMTSLKMLANGQIHFIKYLPLLIPR